MVGAAVRKSRLPNDKLRRIVGGSAALVEVCALPSAILTLPDGMSAVLQSTPNRDKKTITRPMKLIRDVV